MWERHCQATRTSTCSSTGQPPSRYVDWINLTAAPSVHFAPLYLSPNILALNIYAAVVSDLDTLTPDQAMADTEHISKWCAAAEAEIQTLKRIGA
jgi:hypothetical protein